MAHKIPGKLACPPLVGAVVATGRYRDAGPFAAECFVQACGCPCYVVDERDLPRLHQLCGQHIPRPVADELLPFAARWFVFDLLEERPADTILYFDADLLFLNPFDASQLVMLPADNPDAPLKVVRDELHRDVRLECNRQGIDPDRYFNGGLLVMTPDALPRVWQCLVLCHWYMQNSNNFFFHHVHGDKEVFHLAWRRLGLEYAMPRRGIDALAGTMCQHDFQGQRVFQHRNMRKWTLHHNPATPGFVWERECLEYLADLRSRWGPLASIEPGDAALMTELVGRQFHYWRLGHDDRSLELESDGLVGRGAARCETFWWIDQGRLVLADENQTVTARLEPGPQGTWFGRWVNYERMPVLLVPEE